AALFLYISTDPTSVWPIFGFAFAFGIARAFATPAERALPADIVAAERVPWVVARSSVTWQAATILGPVLGGVLYAANPKFPYPAIAAMSATGAVLVLCVRRTATPAPMPDLPPEGNIIEPEDPATKATMHEAVEGLRFIRNHPIVLGAISLDLFAV